MQKTHSAIEKLMKKIAIPFFFLIISISLTAQTKVWTLKECVNHALENNISVKQSELDLEITEADKLEAIGNFLPSLNANASYSKNTGLSLNPTTNQLENTTFGSASGAVNVGYTLFDGLKNVRQFNHFRWVTDGGLSRGECRGDHEMRFYHVRWCLCCCVVVGLAVKFLHILLKHLDNEREEVISRHSILC